MAYWRYKLFHVIGMPLMCLAMFSIAAPAAETGLQLTSDVPIGT